MAPGEVRPLSPAVEDVSTMAPPFPRWIMGGAHARTVFQTPLRLTSRTASHAASCSSSVRSEPMVAMPALASTMSMWPNSAMPAATALFNCPKRRTSA